MLKPTCRSAQINLGQLLLQYIFLDLHLLPAMHSSCGIDVYLRFGDYHDEKSGLSTRMHLPLSKTSNKMKNNFL